MKKNTWSEFYKDRVNTDYQKYFEKNYQPFLDAILAEKPEEIIDVGCGIGSVSKYLNTKDILCAGFDQDPEMLKLTLKNNKWISEDFGYWVQDLFTIPNPIDDVLCITHGLLEHFNDDDIKKAIDIIPYSVHYVPLDKWSTQSFGDERLLPLDYWLELVKPEKHGLFNKGKDLWFFTDKRKYGK